MGTVSRPYTNDFEDSWSGRPVYVVCRSCGLKLRDGEPCTRDGEYYHQPNDPKCKNQGKAFGITDPEIAPFRRKRVRRERHRGAIKASKLRPR